jgi:hypothetical protein
VISDAWLVRETRSSSLAHVTGIGIYDRPLRFYYSEEGGV